MSVLGELDPLESCAHRAAYGEAVLKAVVEDFQVGEVLDISPSGEGEHPWLWVEKCGLNTEEVARHLGCVTDVQQKNVSYAGLGDRWTLTRQWFSLHPSGKADPDLGTTEGADLRILRRTRHSYKLQRGTYAANGFTLRLTGLRAERVVLDTRLERITADDAPNYFGLQRFGRGGGNLVSTRSCAEQDLLSANCNPCSRFLSAGRSYLFNRLLAERVAEGSRNWAAVGDLLAFTDSRSFFPASGEECRDTRLAALDLYPTGPLWGEGGPPNDAGVLDRELALVGNKPALRRWPTKAGTAHEQRILQLPIQGLA